MANLVKLHLYEMKDARAVIADFWRREQSCPCSPHPHDVEDLVNRIGEIYETALARGTTRHHVPKGLDRRVRGAKGAAIHV
jgi:hypothetical protein